MTALSTHPKVLHIMEPQDKKNDKPLSFEELADQKSDQPKNSSAPESASDAESAKKPAAPAKPPIAAPKKPAPKPESAATTETGETGGSAETKAAAEAKSDDAAEAAQEKPSIAQPSPTKFAAERKAAKSKIDPSISVDDDSTQVSGAAIAIDAIAAAAAIAFTVLILQEALPFLK